MRQQIEFPDMNRSRILADRNVPTLQWQKSLGCLGPAVQLKYQQVCSVLLTDPLDTRGSKIIIREDVLHSYWPARPSPVQCRDINKGILYRFLCRSGGQLWAVDIINPNESDLTLCVREEYHHRRLVIILGMFENYYILSWGSGK